MKILSITYELVESNKDRTSYYAKIAMNSKWKKSRVPKLWSGNSVERIVSL